MRKTFVLLLIALALAACKPTPPLSPAQQALLAAARADGASELKATPRDDGGLRLNGRLDGHGFNLSFPKDWNRQAMLFADGYDTPGSPIERAPDPLKNDKIGVFSVPYAQGFAVGQTDYDKSGLDVQGAVANLHRLRDFVQQIGATKTYLIGASMGGNIVVALMDDYPRDFAGAMIGCGDVGDWPSFITHKSDVRAAYNYFTKGTRYALPGEQDLRKSALPESSWNLVRLWRTREIVEPVYALFEAAAKDPHGAEQRMIDAIAAASDTPADVASIALPLWIDGLGTDDMFAMFGGSIVDTTHKVYRAPNLSDAENAALNAGIQRLAADPQAVANANRWHKANGNLQAPLLSLYSRIDALGPYDMQQKILKAAVDAAGKSDLLLLREVPPVKGPLPLTKLKGYAHCGFTPQQIASAWNDLRGWAETGKKPPR